VVSEVKTRRRSVTLGAMAGGTREVQLDFGRNKEKTLDECDENYVRWLLRERRRFLASRYIRPWLHGSGSGSGREGGTRGTRLRHRARGPLQHHDHLAISPQSPQRLEVVKVVKMVKVLRRPHPRLLRAALSGTSGAPPSIHLPPKALCLSRNQNKRPNQHVSNHAHNHDQNQNHTRNHRVNPSHLRHLISWTSARPWPNWPISPPT
jgi:hypothetical protein